MDGRMVTIRLWVIFAVAGAAVLPAGCVRQQQPLAELPVHDLDLSAPAPVARETPRAPVLHEPPAAGGRDVWEVSRPRAWRYIVIHHSATDKGNAAEFDLQHRKRGWDELGYHFVIDNGQGGPDGRIEVGHRWKAQKTGAHTGGTPGNEYNEYGIGICLVGDFRNHLPSAAQLASLRQLTDFLVAHYDVPPQNIIGHCDAPNATTQCPGAALHRYVVDSLRSAARGGYAYRE
jgi:hypothetical protein